MSALYRIVVDGNDILSYDDPSLFLISPTLNMELNVAGSLEFTMVPNHAYYNSIKLLKSTVEVYEDGELIWFGRPTEIRDDYWKQRQVYCEGALAFFKDTVQRPIVYENISLASFFTRVIHEHNRQASLDRCFLVGNITMPYRNIYRETDYENSFDVLKRQCLDTSGGYFFFRRERDPETGIARNYIDWLTDHPNAEQQGEVVITQPTSWRPANTWTGHAPQPDTYTEEQIYEMKYWNIVNYHYDPKYNVYTDVYGNVYTLDQLQSGKYGNIYVANNGGNSSIYSDSVVFPSGSDKQNYIVNGSGGGIKSKRSANSASQVFLANTLEDESDENTNETENDVMLAEGAGVSRMSETKQGQRVEFGLNLLDFNSTIDISSLITAIIPLGDIVQKKEENDENENGDNEEPRKCLTIESITGSDTIRSAEAVAEYGVIVKAVRFSNIKDPQELYNAGLQYLQDTQFDNTIIQCSAVDLHTQNEHYVPFRIGQIVHCHSTPHLLNRDFPISKITINLDSAYKQITLGTPQKRTLSEIYEKPQKHWFGSQEEYDGLSTIDSDTTYFIELDYDD